MIQAYKIRLALLGAAALVLNLTVFCGPSSAEQPAAAPAEHIGFYDAHYDAEGKLAPPVSWDATLAALVKSSLEHSSIPESWPPEQAPELGPEILAWIDYWRYMGKSERPVMRRAVDLGGFALEQGLTPDARAWPRVPHGGNAQVVIPAQAGATGYAFVALYNAQAGREFLHAGQHVADVLLANMRQGTADRAPWPFRVDVGTGPHQGERNAGLISVLRLLDALSARGLSQYEAPALALWDWMKNHHIAPASEHLPNQWITDSEKGGIRDAKPILETARFLLEARDGLDPDWRSQAAACLDFLMAHFAVKGPGGITLLAAHEGDSSADPATTATLGAVAAVYSAAGGGGEYETISRNALTWSAYFIDPQGARAEPARDYVEAMLAVPAWSDGPRGPLARPEQIGFHPARYNAEGKLLPWLPLGEVIQREMAWYKQCDVIKNGYPSWVYATFIDDNYEPFKTDIVPGCQNGMGILSYLKYWSYIGKSDDWVLAMARKQGDYLVHEALTPDLGAWPRFTRSTGNNEDFPLKRASQGDLPLGENVIEPDKGGIAGHALLELHAATGEEAYFEQALHNARLLAKHMRPGTLQQAPWPFRVDSVTGEHWGERNGDMVFILRLFDGLLSQGYEEFTEPRNELWQWIRDIQIPAPDARGENHWMQFFEDQSPEDNRTSWAPLETARYLIEQQEDLAPDWKQLAEQCIQFALRNFSKWEPGGVTTMSEQDIDFRAWGGACSKLGGVAALFYAAGGGEAYGEMAFRNLVWMGYHIEKDGRPGEITGYYRRLRTTGWQTDCHTDKLHNFVDAFVAVPAFAAADDWSPGKDAANLNE